MQYTVIEVTDETTRKEFHKVPHVIYKNDPNFITPLESDIEAVFTKGENDFLEHGKITRWILKDEQGRLAGRVAAFINDKKAFTYNVPTGGMGFFEVVNDKKASFILFDTCKQWLEKHGMEAMDGPINFGENDNYWGLLVEGFMPQSFGMNYNPPYYKDFFEEYGFVVYFEQVSNHLDLRKPFPDRFWKVAEWVMRKDGYSYKHFSLEDSNKFAKDFLEIYNDAWQFHENFTPMTFDQVERMLSKMKDIMIPEFIWFAYYNDEPIAFEVMLPDVNQMLKHFKGKINLLGKLKIALKGKKNILTRARVIILGVKPKYQKSGIESALFWNMDKVMKKHPQFTEIELSWVGDFNPKMRMLHESVGASFGKKHITYRKYFDENAVHQRSTIIPVDTKNKVVG